MPESDRHTDSADCSGRPDADTPRMVAGFRLLRKIGEGGMSSVYQSYDVSTDRPVAVKLLADHLAGQPDFVGRFYREARLSRVLEHTNVVQGYASGFDAEVKKHYLVMEFIDGPTAHGALARLDRLSVGMVVRIGIDIARALDFLHNRQYVHRDVKPDNILLHPDGIAKLADLGLTKRLNDDSQLTSIHQGVGTSYYMPYEQAVNANLVDGRSDIFALGATLYHLLTGEVPFAGTTHDEVVREKWQGTFRRLRELNPTVPKELAQLVEATLACDPRERIQRADQFAKALSATKLATHLPSFARCESTTNAEESDSDDESPTRADHRIPLLPPTESPASPPPIIPPGEAFTQGIRASGPLSPPAQFTPPSTRSSGWPWFVGVGVVVLAGLLGTLTRTQTTAPPLPAVVKDALYPTSSLPPVARQ